MNRPDINVTPLIDVLLVLLIIFMVVTPIKPSAFQAKVPSEPTQDPNVNPAPDTLVLAIENDSTLRLNGESNLGSVNDAQKATDRLKRVFDERTANYGLSTSGDGTIPRTVFIKAPRGIDYGSVAKVVDAAKLAGAQPIALQIDDLVN